MQHRITPIVHQRFPSGQKSNAVPVKRIPAHVLRLPEVPRDYSMRHPIILDKRHIKSDNPEHRRVLVAGWSMPGLSEQRRQIQNDLRVPKKKTDVKPRKEGQGWYSPEDVCRTLRAGALQTNTGKRAVGYRSVVKPKHSMS